MRRMRTVALAAFLVLSVALFTSVSYYLGVPTVAAMGKVSIFMTDPPRYSGNVTSINITFTEIAIHRVDGSEEGTWLRLSSKATTIDLLKIIDVEEDLGSYAVPAGQYNQLRFMVSTATATIDGQPVELEIPSGAQTGLKVHFKPFELAAGGAVTITVDITADDAKIHNGKLVPSMSATVS